MFSFNAKENPWKSRSEDFWYKLTSCDVATDAVAVVDMFKDALIKNGNPKTCTELSNWRKNEGEDQTKFDHEDEDRGIYHGSIARRGKIRNMELYLTDFVETPEFSEDPYDEDAITVLSTYNDFINILMVESVLETVKITPILKVQILETFYCPEVSSRSYYIYKSVQEQGTGYIKRSKLPNFRSYHNKQVLKTNVPLETKYALTNRVIRVLINRIFKTLTDAKDDDLNYMHSSLTINNIYLGRDHNKLPSPLIMNRPGSSINALTTDKTVCFRIVRNVIGSVQPDVRGDDTESKYYYLPDEKDDFISHLESGEEYLLTFDYYSLVISLLSITWIYEALFIKHELPSLRKAFQLLFPEELYFEFMNSAIKHQKDGGRFDTIEGIHKLLAPYPLEWDVEKLTDRFK